MIWLILIITIILQNIQGKKSNINVQIELLALMKDSNVMIKRMYKSSGNGWIGCQCVLVEISNTPDVYKV